MAPAKRPRQSRLTFTPLPSSSPAAKGYNKQIQDRAAAVSLDTSPGPSKRRRILGPEQDQSLLPTPIPSSRVTRDHSAADDTEDEIVVTSNRDGAAARGAVKQQRIDFSRARDPSSFDPPIRLQASSPAPKVNGMFSSPLRGKTIHLSSDDSDDSVEPSPIPGRRRQGQYVSNRTEESDESDAAEHEDVEVTSGSYQKELRSRRHTEVSSDGEDSDMPTTKGTQRRKGRKTKEPEFIDDALSQSESVTDRSLITPKKRRLARNRAFSQREKDDLAEDLDFLAPSSDDEGVASASKPARTQKSKKTAREVALERLKKKRSVAASQAIPTSDFIELSGDEINELNDNTSDEHGQDPMSGLEDANDDSADEFQVLSSHQVFHENDDDAEFLADEEEDNILGVPDGVPLEFTRYASMKAKDLFKYAVEWFVQRKINPAYSRNDEIYKLTFKKLDDEVQGLAGSKFTSSAWTPDFTLALQARPELQYTAIDRYAPEHFMRDHCDACNRGSHPATYIITFHGVPYYKDSLEDVPQNEDADASSDDAESSSSESDTDDTREMQNAQGRQIPPANKSFHVGKFCMANARTAHSLNHWRYHLNQWVETWLIGQQYCTQEKLEKRDRWKTKKRRKYANKIVDRMEDDGVVRQLYRDFKNNIEEARNAKQARYASGFGSP